MRMRILKPAILGLCLTFSAHSELTSSDRDLIKEMTRGELYLKNNVPCRFTSGMGIGAEVVTEVSPTEVDWDRNLKAIEVSNKAKKKRRGVDTIYWGFGPNDVIRYGKLYFKKGGVVELWAEGVKPKDVEVWIRFVGIQTREDFKKAYNLIASNKPIQEDNPDWPAEIRSAVRDRRVVEGMTKAQAFAVVGTPVGIEVNEEGGKKLETWFPRQETGASGDFGKVISSATGFPASLRFVDGKLLTISQSNRSLKVNLDK